LHLTTMYTFLMQQKLFDVTEGFTTKTAANFVLLIVSNQIFSFRKDSCIHYIQDDSSSCAA
jgi:hypothetical protein